MSITLRALASGAIVCAATVAVAAARGRRDSGSARAPIAATSHIVYGDDVVRARPRGRQLSVGLMLNALASVFWAAVYESAFGRAAERGSASGAVLGGAAVSALAYVTDYHAVPSRLTPGWELSVSRRSLAWIYLALAASLPLRGFGKRWRSVRDRGISCRSSPPAC